MKNQNTWNRKFFVGGAIAAITLLASNPAITFAQSIKENSKCAATVQSVKNKITKGRRVQVVDISKDNISIEYQNYPNNRPFRYLFALRGAATESILVSRKLLTSLTKEIVTSCNDVSQVRFGLAETDYNPTFGLISGNKVDAFKCVDPEAYKKLPWGYVICL